MSHPKQKFYHFKRHIDLTRSTQLYEFLKCNVWWGEGILSKKRHTRSAASYTLDEFLIFIDSFPDIIDKISTIIDKYSIRKYCSNIYLNYYKDGNDWTPNHTHPGTTQIVISLGESRTFHYGKTDIPSLSGDVFIFGSAIHGVPKAPDVKNGRISIALFMTDDKPSPLLEIKSVQEILEEGRIDIRSLAALGIVSDKFVKEYNKK